MVHAPSWQLALTLTVLTGKHVTITKLPALISLAQQQDTLLVPALSGLLANTLMALPGQRVTIMIALTPSRCGTLMVRAPSWRLATTLKVQTGKRVTIMKLPALISLTRKQDTLLVPLPVGGQYPQQQNTQSALSAPYGLTQCVLPGTTAVHATLHQKDLMWTQLDHRAISHD